MKLSWICPQGCSNALERPLLAPPASMVISGRMPAYHKYANDLVHQSPKLRKTLGLYYALTQHYEAVRKFKGKWFVCD
jgi:hypothetical protein